VVAARIHLCSRLARPRLEGRWARAPAGTGSTASSTFVCDDHRVRRARRRRHRVARRRRIRRRLSHSSSVPIRSSNTDPLCAVPPLGRLFRVKSPSPMPGSRSIQKAGLLESRRALMHETRVPLGRGAHRDTHCRTHAPRLLSIHRPFISRTVRLSSRETSGSGDRERRPHRTD